MTSTYKVLAQLKPAATTLTTAYTVASATSTTVSSVVVCNTNNTSVTFRISVAIAGAADTKEQYLYYDLPLQGNDTFIATVGVTLAATDVLKVYASATNVAFNFFGVEIT